MVYPEEDKPFLIVSLVEKTTNKLHLITFLFLLFFLPVHPHGWEVNGFHQKRHESAVNWQLADNLPGVGKKDCRTVNMEDLLNMLLRNILQQKGTGMFNLDNHQRLAWLGVCNGCWNFQADFPMDFVYFFICQFISDLHNQFAFIKNFI